MATPMTTRAASRALRKHRQETPAPAQGEASGTNERARALPSSNKRARNSTSNRDNGEGQRFALREIGGSDKQLERAESAEPGMCLR